MFGTLLIILGLLYISIFIYMIKNQSLIKSKIEEKPILQGLFLSFVLINVIILITLIIVNLIAVLDNFGIIDATVFLNI